MNAFMNVYTSIECECIPPHRPLFLIPLFPRLSTPAVHVYLIHECVYTGYLVDHPLQSSKNCHANAFV